MSISCICKLVLGFRVESSDIYTKTRASEPTCSKGHVRSSPQAQFCEQDGQKFVWNEVHSPTPVGIKLAQYFKMTAAEVRKIKDWRDYLNESVGLSSYQPNSTPELHNVASLEAEGDFLLALGLKIGKIDQYDRHSDIVGMALPELQKKAEEVTALRDSLGFPKEREVQIFMSLYFG